ncbi:MAG TPA: cytochrome P450 [Gaiellaceae bacterium]|nr:cytochrome P450 [Gaiellaceae bacterium]
MSATETPEFDPLAPETFSSFHEEFAELRERCPVARSDAWNGFWAVLRYEDVVAVAGDPELFTTSVQNVVPKVAFTGRRPPLHLDPPEHTPYRRALNPYFRPEKIAAFEPVMREIVGGLLEPLVAAGGGDVCAEYTHRLPGHVFAHFFNLTPELGMEIREATREFVAAVQTFDLESVKATSLALYDIAQTVIDLRKAEAWDPEDDPVAGLLAVRVDGEPLPEAMVLGTIRQFIVVGMVAPCVFIGSMVLHLAQHPELQERLRAEPELIPAAVDEYLRLLTPYRGFARTPTRDVELGGRLIREGEPLAVVYASANRDPRVFPDPDEFVLGRPNIGKHVAFGVGPHRCAGAPLATLMLRVTLEELLGRTRAIEQAGEPAMTGWPEWGTLSAPVRLR